MDTPRPPPRTNRTRRVPHPVLIGHAASLSQALVVLGGLAGLSGASLMKHLERTAAWQVWPLLSPPIHISDSEAPRRDRPGDVSHARMPLRGCGLQRISVGRCDLAWCGLGISVGRCDLAWCAWQILACAAVGAVLLTDALGVAHLSPALQVPPQCRRTLALAAPRMLVARCRSRSLPLLCFLFRSLSPPLPPSLLLRPPLTPAIAGGAYTFLY